MKSSSVFAMSLLMFLTGCAANSGVISIGKDTYMVSRQAATGFSGSGTLKAEAFQEANQFCLTLAKVVQVVSTHEAAPPYILGNFPKAEVQFMCLDRNDPALSRPVLRPEPAAVIKGGDVNNVIQIQK
jgi:hypothetical protein